MFGLIILTLSSLWSAYRARRERAEALRKFSGLKPESYKDDSPYFESAAPDCQFSVWQDGSVAGKRTLIGHGFRMEDYLVLPTHVLTSDSDAIIVVLRKHKAVNVVPLKTFKWKHVCADCSVAKIPNGIELQLKKASVGPYWGRPMVNISTNFPGSNSSIGQLLPSSFGVLEYTGSTRPGFSGAVYMLESKAVGMHLGGGVANLAYSTSYLKSLIVRLESSEMAALRNALKKARKDDVTWTTCGNPDEVEVHIHGRYFRVDYDEFMENYNTRYDDEYPDDPYEEEERTSKRRRRGGKPKFDRFKRWDQATLEDLAHDTGRSYEDESAVYYQAESNFHPPTRKYTNNSTQTMKERKKTVDQSTSTISQPIQVHRDACCQTTITIRKEAVEPDVVPENEERGSAYQAGPRLISASRISCQKECPSPASSTISSQTMENLSGLIEESQPLREVSRSTTPTVNRRVRRRLNRQRKKKITSPPSSLKETLCELGLPTVSELEAQSGTMSSSEQSLDSICLPQRVSDNSEPTKTLARPSGGMDFDAMILAITRNFEQSLRREFLGN